MFGSFGQYNGPVCLAPDQYVPLARPRFATSDSIGCEPENNNTTPPTDHAERGPALNLPSKYLCYGALLYISSSRYICQFPLKTKSYWRRQPPQLILGHFSDLFTVCRSQIDRYETNRNENNQPIRRVRTCQYNQTKPDRIDRAAPQRPYATSASLARGC